MYDVVALGELLVDFLETGKDENGVPLFAANPGGAPCNVLSYLSCHGRKTGFIGKVGDDLLGHYLRETIEKVGIDSNGVVLDPSVPTTQAFVRTDAAGERSFSFFRNPGADSCLSVNDLNDAMIKSVRIFHFGSLSMTHSSARWATQKAIQTAKENGALLSFDPNYRPALWDSETLAREQIMYGCSVCDFLKLERSELAFLTGIADEAVAVAKLKEQYPISLITVTAGAEGAAAYHGDICVRQPSFPVNQVVDTTGAGDAFCGGCLHWILDHGLTALTKENLQEMLLHACAGASLVIGRQGALLSMPSREQVIVELLNL